MAATVRAQEEEASSSTSAYTYDVFLSFRGKDTRKNFTDHLYTALMQAGYRTFRDDNEIEKGESLKPELYKAINGSRISIIVFSKDYASSPWCLDELVMILECKKRTSRHVVLPVFYDVRPSEILKQKGRTGEAFDEYVEQYEAQIDHGRKMELMEKVKGWKKALEEVADLAGMELKNQADGHESRFIHKIINCIQGKLRRTPLFVAPYLIGMQSRAKNINKWLQDDSSKISLLGICGMGGIGKTTMAKFIYDENYESFDCSCFLANVREMSQKPNCLASLQRKLLSSILNKKHEKIYNVDEGIIKIKKAVSCKRVLLVIDDVDQINQLNALRGIQEWFYRGSKIIMTTRNERLLKPRDLVFKVEELGHDESVKLFSFYAFGEDRPIEGYAAHTESIVQICGGLPLALQVLGASLSGRTIPQWASEVKKLQAIPDSEICNKLKISYDCLEEYHDKRLFLDIACFFVGKDKDYTVKVLGSTTDTHADVRIQNLIDRSLLTIDSRNKLIMHQLIRDMGRNIVRQESNDELGERSRLWHQKDAYNVLRYKKGTRLIEGLALDMRMLMKDDNIARERKYYESLDNASPLTGLRSFFHHFGFRSFLLGQQIRPDLGNQSLSLTTDAFEKMERLRLLKLNYTQLYGRYDNFPKNLIWLCWHGFPLKYMPIELSLENLVALDLCHSKLEEVWPGRKFLGSLKILNLSFSKRLAKTPNFLGVPNLERLILKGCVSLIEICESIEVLKELNLLDLEDCKNLRMLPRNMHKLRSLEKLVTSGCSTLFAGGNDISATSTANGEDKWWQHIFWSMVSTPRKGPETLWASLPLSLQKLSLRGCNLFDDSFPENYSKLQSLVELNLGKNPFQRLPNSFRDLRRLRNLDIDECHRLQIVDHNCLPENRLYVNATYCTSLEKITPSSTAFLTVNGCCKLGDIKRKGIEDLAGFEFGIFSAFLGYYEGIGLSRENIAKGVERFPMFSRENISKGSSIYFTVPSHSPQRIRCLNVYCTYGSPENDDVAVVAPRARIREVNRRSTFHIAVKIENKTKDHTWIYVPWSYLPWSFTYKPGNDMEWVSEWRFGNQMEAGDEIIVTFDCKDKYEIKECGFNIVYRDGEDENGSTTIENSHHDFPAFRLSSGAYFLCQWFDFALDEDYLPPKDNNIRR